jgi:hypothetical protein
MMERQTFDLQVNEEPLEVCVVIKQPGSFACFSGAPQVTGECQTAEDFDEEINRAISELEQIRALGHKALAKSSN